MESPEQLQGAGNLESEDIDHSESKVRLSQSWAEFSWVTRSIEGYILFIDYGTV